MRPRLTYSDVVSTLCLFLLLAGGTAYALDGSNTVFSDDIVNGEVKNDDLAANAVGSGKIADQQVKNADLGAGASSSNTIADGGVQGIDVLNNSLTGDDIGNVTRSVNLPLASFVNVDKGELIDFSSGADSAPDFASFGFSPLLTYDAASPNVDADFVGSSFTVPQDAISGGAGSFALGVFKESDSGSPDVVICDISLDGGLSGGFFGNASITTVGSDTYTVTPLGGIPFSPGDSIGVSFAMNHDDVVRIQSIEFRYTATQ